MTSPRRNTGGSGRGSWFLAVALLASWVGCGAALAGWSGESVTADETSAPVRERGAGPMIESVRWGFDDSIAVERWTPTWVTVWGGGNGPAPGPGLWGPTQGVADGGLSAFVVVEYRQDGSQSARVMAPITLLPGRYATTELPLTLPFGISSVRIDVREAAPDGPGPLLASRQFGGPIGTSDMLPQLRALPTLAVIVRGEGGRDGVSQLGGARAAFVTDAEALAEATAPALVRVPAHNWPPDPAANGTPGIDPWRFLTPAETDVASLPLNWISYDSTEVVIAGASALASADPRVVAALMTWVDAGGRLLLVADAAGARWAGVLNAVPQADPPAVGVGLEPVPIALSDQVAFEPGAALRELLGEGEGTPLNGRAIRLTPEGARAGWRVKWLGTPAADGAAEPADRTGLLAIGPWGAGMVAVLGAEPGRMALGRPSASARRLWRAAIGHVLPISTTVGIADGQSPGSFSAWHGSGRSPEERLAIESAADRSTRAPAIGWSLFLPAGLLGVGMAILVGPVDWVMLRRGGRRRWSWLTAMGWTLAASGLVAALPGLWNISTRAPSTAGRFEMIDAVFPADGSDRPPRAWRTSVTSLFAGRATVVTPPDLGLGTWIRGVSPLPATDAGVPGAWLETIPVSGGRIAGPGESGDAAAAVGGGRGSMMVRGAAASPLRLPPWSTRVLVDVTPGVVQTPRRIRVGRDGVVRVSGLPVGSSVARVTIGLRDGWRRVEGGMGPDGTTWEGVVGRLESQWEPEMAHWLSTHGESPWSGWGSATGLPLSAARTHALLTRVVSGRTGPAESDVGPGVPDDAVHRAGGAWGVVMVETEFDDRARPFAGLAPEVRVIELLRAVVPLERGFAAPAPTGASEEGPP